MKPVNKFKTYKYDAAPFFFFIDIFSPDYENPTKPLLVNLINSIKHNPIMPLPMRVDRVFNGERSVLIRPKEPISFPITEELTAIINPIPFLQQGFEKLLYFTEVRSREKFFLPLTFKHVSKWWDLTKFLYGKLPTLEEDFSAFLRAYLHTMIKAKILDEDLVDAAKAYCKLISDICEKRAEQNVITIDIKGEQRNVKMYKVKDVTYYKKFKKTQETQYRPELIDIDIHDFSKTGFPKSENNLHKLLKEIPRKEIKYIPLLFYDDLLECMLQNQNELEKNEVQLLDPSHLLDSKAIITLKTKDLEKTDMNEFSWGKSFDSIKFEPFVETIIKIERDYIQSLAVKELGKL